MKIINIVGTGKAHFGSNTFAHGQETYGVDDCYMTAKEVSRFMKFYTTKDAIDNAENGRFRRYQAAYELRKALVVTTADIGCAKQRVLDMQGLQNATPYFNLCGAENIAFAEAVNGGATEIVLYRMALTNGNADIMGALLHNVNTAEAMGVKIRWAWRKYIASKVAPIPPAKIEKPKAKRKPRKSQKKDKIS